MRHTTHWQLPVAEENDNKDAFPLSVDGPAKDQLDKIGQTGGLVNRNTDNLVMPSATWTNIPFDRTVFLQNITFDGTYYDIPYDGIYVVTGAIAVKETTPSTTVYMGIRVNDGDTTWTDRYVLHRGYIGGPSDSLTGAINVKLAAGDRISLAFYGGASYTLRSGDTRFGVSI